MQEVTQTPAPTTEEPTAILDLAEYHAGLSARLANTLECQNYDNVGILADLIAECEQQAASSGYVLAIEMQEDRSFRAMYRRLGSV